MAMSPMEPRNSALASDFKALRNHGQDVDGRGLFEMTG